MSLGLLGDLDDRTAVTHTIPKWIGLSRSASWLWVTGAFRFLGKDFEAVAIGIALAVFSKFLFDNFISSIWLIRLYDPPGDRLRNEVCELQTS